MTSIEKAMDKLAGFPSRPAEKEADQPVAADVEPAVEDVPSKASAAAENPPADTEESERAIPNASPRSEDDVPAGEDGDGPYVHIDFARLSAAGNLTPDAESTRLAEEYQYIKRRLLGNIALGAGQKGRPANLIMVTSSVPGEGKTFTSTNLAMSMSIERDHTILLVDTDIMKRDLSRQFGLSDAAGLFDYLDHRIDDIGEVIYRTNIPNLCIIPVGNFTKVSTELLASTRMRELVGEFATRYSDRVVVFDTPPLLATTTAVALAPLVGQLALVVEAGETRSKVVDDALRTLDRVQITGMILNKSKGSTLQNYDYYGYYQYEGERPG